MDLASQPGRAASAAAVPGGEVRNRFGGLGLVQRIALWTVVLAAFTAAVVAAFLYRSTADILVDREMAVLQNSLGAAAGRFVNRIELAQRDAIYLAQMPAARAVANSETPLSAMPAALGVDRLAIAFATWLASRPAYYEASYAATGTSAVELFRVRQLESGQVERLPPEAPSPEDRRNLAEAALLPLGAVLVYGPRASLDSTGARKPIIRIATPAFDDRGAVAGVAALDLDAAYLFELIAEGLGGLPWFAVADHQGEYMLSVDLARSRGVEPGIGRTMPADFPVLAPVFEGVSDSFSGFFDAAAGRSLVVARRVAYEPGSPTGELVFAATVPEQAVLGRTTQDAVKAAALAVALVLTAALFAVLLTRRIVRPIETITRAATRLAAGERVDVSALMRRRDETGELARAFNALAEEIDQRERSLTEQATELMRSNQDLSQFAYVASHDLQEPLRMVASYLGLLERRYGDKLDSEAREFIGYAVDGAARMKRLINDLLGYSRAGNAPLAIADVDAREIVAGVVATLSLQIAEAHGQVNVDPLPVIRADAVQLARVFQNLIDNALKYRSRAAPRVRILAEPIDGFWKFSVRNNGIGVDPRFSEKIFEIFKRLHSRDRYPGTGVGLAVCKLVVERHGGRIWVEPRPGGGSIFSFTIPRQEA